MIDNVSDIIMLLGQGMTLRKTHFSDHPQLYSLASRVLGQLHVYFSATESGELLIGVRGGSLVFEGQGIFGPTVAGKQLIRFAERLQCGGFGFQRGLTIQDLLKFFDISELKSLPIKSAVEAETLFGNYGIKNLRVLPQAKQEKTEKQKRRFEMWRGRPLKDGVVSSTTLFQDVFDVVATAHSCGRAGEKIDIGAVRNATELILRYIKSGFGDAMQHVHYPEWGSYTVGHSVRVAYFVVYVGLKMALPEKELLSLGFSALLHDIGFCRIPETILDVKNRLTPDEIEIIQRHPQLGVDILLEQSGVTYAEITAAWGHHLRYDGGGYPHMPSWSYRSPRTALLQICDVFEALTAIRPHKLPFDPARAFAEMVGDPGAFHPGLLATFISVLGLYPPGSYVKLSDERIGVVSEAGLLIDRPVVRITEHSGDELPVGDQYEIDLMESKLGWLTIEKTIPPSLT